MYRAIFLLLSNFFSLALLAQRKPDQVYNPDIRTVKLFQQNNQEGMAILSLNSGDQLELHFDDMSGIAHNYYYSYVLCNADWTPANLNVFDYVKGYTQNRIGQYRNASFASTKYVHYQALLPERNCVPSKSGNYLLKVFRDSDTSKLAFTKRILVVDNLVSIGAQVQQPYDFDIARSHQKIQFSVNTKQLNILSPRQTNVVIMQNNRWDEAITNLQPSFIRNNVFEYNGEQDCLFQAGKEYRWADLRSFRFQSDRVESMDKSTQPNHVFLKPDPERNSLRYLFFADRNGWDEITTTESINPWWQSEYAYVHFNYVPSKNQPYAGKNVYLLGEMTGNQISDSSLMSYDAEKGAYTKMLLLKQGYYSYNYVTRDAKNTKGKAETTYTEGNYWETENRYTILFYYRSFSSRHDELIGITTLNSRLGLNR